MEDAVYIQNALDDIASEIKSEQSDCDIISFEDFWMKKHSSFDTSYNKLAFLNDLAVCETKKQVEYYMPLTVFKNHFTFIIIPVKKVIRKLLKFIILPLNEQQNSFNLNVVRCFRQIRSYMGAQEATAHRISIINNSVLSNSQNIDEVNKRLSEMSIELEALKKENQQLKKEIAEIGGEKA